MRLDGGGRCWIMLDCTKRLGMSVYKRFISFYVFKMYNM